MKKPETKFREKCDKFLNTLDNAVHESVQQVAIHGTCDKIICCHGFGVWAELKDEAGLPTTLQIYKASKWRNQGKGIAFVWRPQNDMLVKRFLTQLNAGVFDKAMLSKINKEENL